MNDLRYEEKIEELWGDSSYVLDSLESAIYKDDVLEAIMSYNHYMTPEQKAEILDTVMDQVADYLSDIASGGVYGEM